MRDHKALSTYNVSKGVSKITRSSVIGIMDDGIHLSSFDSAMKSKEKKNRRATFKIQIKIHCLSLKADDNAMFNNSPKTLHL